MQKSRFKRTRTGAFIAEKVVCVFTDTNTLHPDACINMREVVDLLIRLHTRWERAAGASFLIILSLALASPALGFHLRATTAPWPRRGTPRARRGGRWRRRPRPARARARASTSTATPRGIQCRLPGPCLCAVCAGRLARRHHHHQQTVHPRRRCRISRWCSGCSHTTLTAADNDDWQPTHFAAHGHLEVLQWRSKAAAGAISCIWAKPSSLNLSATPLRTSPNGTEGMRRKTSLRLHGTGPVALIEAVRKFPNH